MRRVSFLILLALSMLIAVGCGEYGKKYSGDDGAVSSDDEARITDADFTDEKVRLADGCDDIEEQKSEGRQHTTDPDESVDYKQNPPSSGNHYQVPLDWGIYDTEQRDTEAVHNLEHGHIWITYKGISDAEYRKLLGDIKVNNFHIMSMPRKKNPKDGVYYTTWTKQIYCKKPSEAALQYMIDNWRDQGPELFTDDKSMSSNEKS